MLLPSDNGFPEFSLIELQSVDSTNNYALKQIHEDLAHPGACYFAHEQKSGKGQRGKSWDTEKGANITISIVIKPDLQLNQQFLLSAAVVVAVQFFFKKYAGDETRIKWPNDIYWQDKKAGGILIENIIKTDGSATGIWQWAVIGIGININQTKFANNLPNPISLKLITGKNFDTLQLAKEVCESVYHFYKQLFEKNSGNILKLYRQHLYKKTEKVKLKKGSRIFEAVIKDVSSDGRLIVHHAMEESFEFGEVQWLL